MDVGDAATSPTQDRSFPGPLHRGRVSSSGVRGKSPERPAALETAPEGWRPRSAAPWRARGRGALREWSPGGSSRGDRPDPPSPGASRLRPRPPIRPERRSPPPTPAPRSPTPRPPARPSAAAGDPTPTAPSPGPEEAAGGGAAGPRPVPGGGRGAARTAPPPRRNKAPRRRAGERAALTAHGRAWARGAPRAGPGPSARCSPRAAGPPGGSRARRPGQRRRRRSLLRPGSLLRRVFSLAGSPPPPPPPPPQPRLRTGCSSPSRPGRAAGNIPETAQRGPAPLAARAPGLPAPPAAALTLSAGFSAEPAEKGPPHAPRTLHPLLDAVTSDGNTRARRVHFTPAGVQKNCPR
ncbi:basic proline-rich protein-like [Meriones unguiculatus]|uniref:basic proline-rich protein-like n=1 Tax=Meriones unguiculatus TaxID=10047 RepID=UPI00293EFB75|nr:basic proline-rich protein-like [Meriones unguiculatus]